MRLVWSITVVLVLACALFVSPASGQSSYQNAVNATTPLFHWSLGEISGVAVERVHPEIVPGAGNNPRLDGSYRGPGKGYYSSTDNTLARGATGLPIPGTWDSGGVSIADASAAQDYGSGTNGGLSDVRIPGRSCQYSPLTGTCTPLAMMGLQAFTANVWVFWNGYRTVVHSETLHRNPDNGIIGSPCWASTCNWSGWYLDIKGKLFNPQTDSPATGQLRFVRRGYVNGQNTTSELLAPAGQIPTGQWTMVTASYDGTTMKLYVNGQTVASATSTVNIQGAPAYAYIGGHPTSGSGTYGYLEGTADEATIWRRALTDTELQSIYQSGLPSPTTQPRILGELSSVGETATADPGVWDSTTTLTYQWYRCTTAGNCTLIPAAGSTYVISPDDAGHRLRVRVTAVLYLARSKYSVCYVYWIRKKRWAGV
ncbi:MAG: LamG domain-containing protein [Gaiellales bacterium]